MSTVVRELLTVLGFDYNESGFKKSEAGFKSLLGFAAELTDRVIGIGRQLFDFVAAQAKLGEQSHLTAKALGTTAENIQAMNFFAAQSGVDSGAMQMGLRTLYMQANQAAGGNKKLAESFAKAGIAVKDVNGHVRPASDLFADLSTKIANTENEGERLELAYDLLGRRGAMLIPALMAGGEEFKKQTARARELGFVISNETAAAMDDFGDSTNELSMVFQGMKSRLATELLPVFKKAIDTVVEWTIHNRELIDEWIQRIGRFITISVNASIRIAAVLDFLKTYVLELVAAFVLLKLAAQSAAIWGVIRLHGQIAAIAGETGRFAGLISAIKSIRFAAVASVAPFVALGLAIGAIFVIAEDVYQYLTGGRSLIGLLIDDFVKEPASPNDTFIVKVLRSFFGWVYVALEAYKKFVADVVKEGNFVALTNVFTTIFVGWKKEWEDFEKWLGDKIGGIAGRMVTDLIPGGRMAKTAVDNLAGVFAGGKTFKKDLGVIWDALPGGGRDARQFIADDARLAPVPGMAYVPPSVTNASFGTPVININVTSTSASTEDIGAAASDGMSRVLADAQTKLGAHPGVR